MAKRKTAPARSKAATLDLAAANSAVAAVDQLTVEQLVQQMGGLQTTVQGSLASLSAQLTAKLEEKNRIDLAITEKERRFRELTDKEAAAVELDELNLEIEAQREAWEREQELYEEDIAARDQQRAEAVARQDANAKYEHEQKLAQWTREFNATVEESQRTERLRQADLQRGWDQREAELKAKEDELASLRSEVAAFPAKLKAEVDAAVSTATNALKATHEHTLALERRENKATQDLANAARKQAEDLVESLRAQILAAETRATEAEQRTLTVMNNALNVDAARRQADAVASVATSTSGGAKR